MSKSYFKPVNKGPIKDHPHYSSKQRKLVPKPNKEETLKIMRALKNSHSCCFLSPLIVHLICCTV